MQVNIGNLATLFISFNGMFQRGVKMITPDWKDIAMESPSGTLEEEYGWLGEIENVREWIGPRQTTALTRYAYRIRNRDWERTVEVDRNVIEDDRYGVYGPKFEMMGRSIARAPNRLVYSTLLGGFANPCYDGQPFFDADHPVLVTGGGFTTMANTDVVAGTGPAWFLYDSSMPPLIFQNRKPFELVAKDRPDDDNVFMLKKFLYGADARYNAGYGFWQYIWGSTQPLTPDSYAAARDALIAMTGDYGAVIGVNPDTLLVPSTLESQGRAILIADRDQYGATNIWEGSAKLKVSPWLTAAQIPAIAA